MILVDSDWNSICLAVTLAVSLVINKLSQWHWDMFASGRMFHLSPRLKFHLVPNLLLLSWHGGIRLDFCRRWQWQYVVLGAANRGRTSGRSAKVRFLSPQNNPTQIPSRALWCHLAAQAGLLSFDSWSFPWWQRLLTCYLRAQWQFSNAPFCHYELIPKAGFLHLSQVRSVLETSWKSACISIWCIMI